jgi:hypothetical protein
MDCHTEDIKNEEANIVIYCHSKSQSLQSIRLSTTTKLMCEEQHLHNERAWHSIQSI